MGQTNVIGWHSATGPFCWLNVLSYHSVDTPDEYHSIAAWALKWWDRKWQTGSRFAGGEHRRVGGTIDFSVRPTGGRASALSIHGLACWRTTEKTQKLPLFSLIFQCPPLFFVLLWRWTGKIKWKVLLGTKTNTNSFPRFMAQSYISFFVSVLGHEGGNIGICRSLCLSLSFSFLFSLRPKHCASPEGEKRESRYAESEREKPLFPYSFLSFPTRPIHIKDNKLRPG